MKKSLTLILSFCLLLGTTFAASLDQELSTLTEQILLQSTNKEKTLTDLKEIFTNCAEQHADLQIKSACKTRIDQSFPLLDSKFGSQIPQKVDIKLKSEDMKIHKIGEQVDPILKETVNHYLLSIPKYNLNIEFYFQTGVNTEYLFKKWNRIQSGNISIPEAHYGTEQRTADFRKDISFALYSAPWLHEKSSLEEVGKAYRKVYQDVARISDRTSLYQTLKKANGTIKKVESDYIIGGKALPLITGKVDGIKNSHSKLYGVKSFSPCQWSEEAHFNNFLEKHIDQIQDGSDYKQCSINQEARGYNTPLTQIIWTATNPKYFIVILDNESLSKLILK